ncbi:MAG: hypothetical protein KAW45_09440, partial [Thermoplasmatales archaeon]|nr:hypothetical protein [Thermoplasmatales archaeon]
MNKSLIKSLFSIMLMSLLISTSIISAQHTSNSKIKLINTAEEDSSEGSYLPLPLVYNFNTLEIETVELSGQIFSKVILEEHSNFHETGKPVLPVASAKVLIPYGEKFEDIEISSVDTISISVDDPVEPGQQFYPFSYEGDIEYIPPDSEIYESDSLFPDKKYEIVSVQKFRGFNVLILRLYPVQYNPKNGQLLFTPTLKIENIETTPIDPDQYHQNYRGLQKDIDAVSSFVDNPETIESYPGSFPSEVYQYVIITSEELKNYNGDFNFQALRDEHISGGLNAKIVTIEEIENGYTGIDTQQKIRNFIRYAYNNWQTEYVLLGGDDPIVPARILHA